MPFTKRFMLLFTVLVIVCTVPLHAFAQAAGSVAEEVDGEAIFASKCAACHRTGLLEAPKTGAAADWKARLARGRAAMVANAISGFNKMPPRGGNPGLTDEMVASAVDFMLSTLDGADTSVAKAVMPKPPAKKAPPPRKRVKRSGANAFNRLMKPPSQRNPPPTRDGIHDSKNAGTRMLQGPRDAFLDMPKSLSGNRVDWVAALNKGHIEPRYDRDDANAKPVILDLNIVREVKGSMPNVVYPHKQHTEWLDCSNCHPAIFVPQKGANKMSMAGIILGKQCGVCHGKVAFPVADCRRCHSAKK